MLPLLAATEGSQRALQEAVVIDSIAREIELSRKQEETESYLLGMTVDEYKQYLADLCEDAGSIGTLGPF